MANLYNVPTQNAIQRTLANTLNSGETTTITFATSVSGVLQASATIPGILVIDRVDQNGNLTPSLTEYISFTGVSGSTVTGLTRALAGTTAISHSVGAIVEFVPDVTWADAINDVFTEQHNADGTHKTLSSISLASVTMRNSLIDTNNIINSTLDAFTFNSGFSNMSNATQGNLIAFNQGKVSPITNGIVEESLIMASTASGLLPTYGSSYLHKIQRQGGNASIFPSGGTTNYVETSVLFQTGSIDCVGMTTAGNAKSVTFPVAYTQSPVVFVQFYDTTSSHFGVVGNVRSITTTGFSIVNGQTGINSTSQYFWWSIGK